MQQALPAIERQIFKLGAAQVDATRNVIGYNGQDTALEPRIMDVLCVLAERPGEVFARRTLIDRIWQVEHGGDESLSRAISIIRKALRDAGATENYIETISRRGYRLLLPVTHLNKIPRTTKALPVAADKRVRIAVLPFRLLAAADDQGYFADGIVDELITALGQEPQLLVAGRRSSFHYKESKLSLSQIATDLGVSHVVDGSVQLQGDSVRIDVSLIEGKSGFEQWSYNYDGTLSDIFASRKEVGKAVVKGLAKALNLDSHEPKIRDTTANRDAYRLYMQGQALAMRAIGDGVLPKAIELLERALVLDPTFAQCWSALAEAHHYTVVYSPCRDRLAQTDRMAECARQALALDPGLGHALTYLGIQQWTKNNVVGALDLSFEAYRSDPDSALVNFRLGLSLMYIGRTAEAFPYVLKAIDLDPANPRISVTLCAAYLNMGDIDAAIEAGQRVEDLGHPSVWTAVAMAAKGDHQAAVAHYQKSRLLMNTIIIPPEGSVPLSEAAMDAYWLMAAKGICGDQPEDRASYCQLLEMMHATLHDPNDTTIVLPAIWMGNAQMVFKTLGAQITPANLYPMKSIWADLDPIRQIWQHPDFMGFASHIGLVAAWEKYGWPDLLPKPAARYDISKRRA
jgi:TolB-like protein